MMRKPGQFILALVVISALLFLLDQSHVFSVGAAALNKSVVGPVGNTGGQAVESGTGFLASLLSFRAVVSNLSHAEQERDFYRGEYFRLQAVEEENALLRQALNVEQGSQQLVLTHVVSFNPLAPNQELLLDKGSVHGIKVGQAVIADGRTFVGLVRSVEPTQSTVLLVTSEDARTPALLATSDTNAAIRGSATGVLELDLVPRETPLQEGELVLTSGITGDIPSQLLIGEIRRIIDDETASFKRATVEPFVDIGSLRQVFVVTGNR